MKQKIRIILIFISFLPVSLVAQNSPEGTFSAGVYDGYLTLQAGEAEFFSFFNDLPEMTLEGEYQYSIQDNIPFIEIFSEPYVSLVFLSNEYFAYLSLVNYRGETLFINKQKITEIIESSLIGRHDLLLINYASIYEASSYLIEGETEYLPSNLERSAIIGPWVEGVSGSGIGEVITVQFVVDENGNPNDYWNGFPVNGLLISNGFVSSSRPSLYGRNNRIKSIRITDFNGNFSFEIELADSPSPQIIRLPDYTNKVTIEILEVYNGSQWDDTCLNFILGIRGLK
ncbi:NADase-type glycan-binding domain-containing protein [Spirochaeta lutea]|uniref:NAD glycohydrolase translocation F5/8 type C domain-containing protein n=1 Tax=Spirochaeta lutea TaxID=1480694 RepID=A0A098QX13_9SPIO|nr:hypothetical protein [Spirochaeta lutea]KGE72111.1 hypothetical protein DC28_07785 [Spirochaeta lutea]